MKNETLAQVLSCEFCKIRQKNFFAQHRQKNPSDYASINNINNKRKIGKRNCKL